MTQLLRVAALAPKEVIANVQPWAEHAAATEHIPVATPDDITWADAVIFDTPTRFGNVTSQLKQFLDTLVGLWAQGLLADKVCSGFTSTSQLHGGQESTLLALYNSIYLDYGTWRRVLAVNLDSQFLMVKSVLPAIGRGRSTRPRNLQQPWEPPKNNCSILMGLLGSEVVSGDSSELFGCGH
ncbi:NAD(P)H-dependent oxidoreductase, partial [Streptomyces sp. NPDC002159]